MITRTGTAFVAMILALIFCQTSLEAQRRNQDRNQAQAAAPPPPVGPKASSPEEFQAFQGINTEQNPTNRITLSDNFLSTYPNSQLAGYVHRFRMETFTRFGKHKEAAQAGETALNFEIKFLQDLIAKADAEMAAAKSSGNTDNKRDRRDRNAPPPTPPLDKNSKEFQAYAEEVDKAMLYYYQSLMNSYQQLNDAPKTIEWAEKALGQDPENLLTLLTISSVMAERPPVDEKQKEEQMKKAEEFGKKALTKVTQLISGPIGAQMTADQKQSLESTAHQTLGLVYLNLKKYGDAQRAYLAAVTAKKDDPVSYFRLGLAYAQDKPPKVDPALEALAKSVFLKGVTEPQATDVLKQLYQAKNKSLDGLDQFVKEAGQKITP